jgi:hypothetical protein
MATALPARNTAIQSATQPDTTTTLQAPLVIKPEGIQKLGAMLAGRFKQYEWDRRLAELKWTRNARQFLGIYDQDIIQRMDINRSQAYPKLTRWKCVSMLSRLMNLLFQASDKNWGIDASAVPNLSEQDLQTVLDTLMPPPPAAASLSAPSMPAAPPPPPPSDEVIEQAIRNFAKVRAKNLEREVTDQLQELGGAKTFDYVSLCREVMMSGIQYGAGILKGPYIEEQEKRKWKRGADGRMQAITYTAYRPRFEFVPIWEYYPDMGAKYLNQMDGQFQRVIMSKHQLVMLKQRPDFFASQIDKFLKQSPTGNYMRKAYETELRGLGVQINTAMSERVKFEAIVWEGYVHGQELADAGLDIPDDKLNEDVKATVWIMGDTVIKAMVDPWTTLKTDGEMPMYHFFIFEKDESFILGNGLPNIVRDSQMGLCAATRMVLDNASVMRVFEFNTELLRIDQDISAVTPDKIFYREDDSPQTMQYPAIRTVELPMHLPELQKMVEMFQGFADQETFINAATGGDMQRGPSEPFRTASGASMLRGDAALPFKDAVRNFDQFTESVISAIITFNEHYSQDPELQGDFQPVARGATSLIAKEVLGAQLDNLAQTLLPEEKKYIKFRSFLRERLRARDLDDDDIVMDDAGCDAVDQNEAQQQQAQQAQQQKAIETQIRLQLSEIVKNISQATKNQANAEGQTVDAILNAVEHGVQLNANAQNQPQPGTGGPAPADDTGMQGGTGAAGPNQTPSPVAAAPGPSAAAMPTG